MRSDVATSAELQRVGDPNDDQSSVAFSPDGKVLAATGIDADIRFWDVAGIFGARSSGPGAIRRRVARR